jgi:ABC-type uncharacterized transport system permease subunit
LNLSFFKSQISHFKSQIFAIAISFLIGAVFIGLIGRDPFEIYSRLFADSLGSTYGIGQILFKATSLILTGLSFSLAFRAGLLNIGAEGQLYVGTMAVAVCGFVLASLPFFILIPLCILAGFLGGGLWGFIPGILKSRFGSHEVINTIMLNFTAYALCSYLVNQVFIVPATIHTPEISASAFIPRLDSVTGEFRGSPVNLSLLISVAACLVIHWLFRKTPLGYEITVLGLNKNAARYAKLKTSRLMILSMTLAGGIAGLGGTNFVMGYKHYFELGFSENAGFIGIAVAIIGKNNPFGIILAALFFGLLEYGGLTVNSIVPKEIVTILQAIIILAMITFSSSKSLWSLRAVREKFSRLT